MRTPRDSSTSHGPRRGGSSGRSPHKAATSPRAPRGPRKKVEPLHPTEIPPDIHNFREWDLGEAVQGVIAAMGIEVPTPIQKLAIGPVLAGRDVIAKAETGTGKTLAFGAPMIAKIDPARASVLGLVLCPTRELAEQVMKVLEQLGAPRNVKVALIVGGEPMGPQVAALKAGAQVVVGTPGRILDLYNQRFLQFPWTEFAILDEADVMLEIGFIDDVKQILSFTPDERQTLLFSATFPSELLELARAYTKNPVEVATAAGIATVDKIEQTWMQIDDDDRPLALTRLIEQSDADDVFLVFCDKRTEVDRLMRRLERLPYSLKALHGGYDQEARFRVMSAFRTKEVKALVATDVASRGLDVLHVTHVVNYSAPRDLTDYTHRIGRTGRAGRSGRAITFVTRLGMRYWSRILQEKNWPIAEAELPGPTRGRSAGIGAPRSGRDRDARRPAGPLRPEPRSDRTPRAPRATDGDTDTPDRADRKRWPIDPAVAESDVGHVRARARAVEPAGENEQRRDHGDARPASRKPHGDKVVDREHAEPRPGRAPGSAASERRPAAAPRADRPGRERPPAHDLRPARDEDAPAIREGQADPSSIGADTHPRHRPAADRRGRGEEDRPTRSGTRARRDPIDDRTPARPADDRRSTPESTDRSERQPVRTERGDAERPPRSGSRGRPLSDSDRTPRADADRKARAPDRAPAARPSEDVRAPRESAPRESAPRESAPRESAPRESAPRESAPRESAPRQSSPREPAARAPAAHEPGTSRPSRRPAAARDPRRHDQPPAQHREQPLPVDTDRVVDRERRNADASRRTIRDGEGREPTSREPKRERDVRHETARRPSTSDAPTIADDRTGERRDRPEPRTERRPQGPVAHTDEARTPTRERARGTPSGRNDAGPRARPAGAPEKPARVPEARPGAKPEDKKPRPGRRPDEGTGFGNGL